MARRASARRIKANRTYEIPEAAEAVNVTPQTIRAWGRRGLRIMTGQRPYLILGADMREFLGGARQAAKRPREIGLFHCLRCKASRPPAFEMADYHPLSASHGRLTAFCAACEGRCNRIVRLADLPEWRMRCEIGGSSDQ